MQTFVEHKPSAESIEQISARLILSNGVMLHYVAKIPQERPALKGIDRAIILVHGYSDSWRSFEEMLELLPLDEWAMPIFAVDLRGHGGSSEAPSGTYEQQDFADDLAAFMDALSIQKAIIIGHSMGGLIAHHIAISYPDKVDGLVLIATTTTLAGWEGMDDMKAFVRSLPDDAPAPVDFVQAFQASTFYGPPLPSVLHRYVSESLRLRGKVWKAILAGLEHENHAARLSQIAAPTLILWGEQDALFSREQQEELAAVIPDTKLVVYPEAGHALNVERATDVVQEIVRFMEEMAYLRIQKNVSS